MEALAQSQETDTTIYGAIEGHDARILADKAREIMPLDKVLVHVALDDNRLSTLKELVQFFAPDVEIIEFPAWDCLPYDRVSPNTDIVAKRVAALTNLLRWQSQTKRYPRILLTTVNAITQRIMPRTALKDASFIAQKGGLLDVEKLQVFLTQNGYNRTETVRESGEYAMRGGIIDLYPPAMKDPVRLDLFGDEVETIRAFDPLSQRTHTNVDQFALQPVTEFFLDEHSIDRFRTGYRKYFGVIENDPLYESVSEGRRYNGMEHWLPLFYEQMDTLLDYAGDHTLILDHHGRRAHDERFEQIEDFYQSRKILIASQTQKKSKDVSLTGSIYRPLPPSDLYIENNLWGTILTKAEFLSPFAKTGDENPTVRKARDFADIRSLPDGDVIGELKTHVAKFNDRKTIIACYSLGARQRVQGLLEAGGFEDLKTIDDAQQLKKLKTHETGLAVLGLEHGFNTPDLAVLTEQDILGDRLSRKAAKRKRADNFLREVSSLDEGDLVTHIDHGIGKFLELETVTIGKIHHDCLKIEYAGGDRLFVPVENIEVLARFGGEESTTQLDKLGGAGWQARKAKVKKDLMAMADGLLKIAAARTLKKTEPIEISKELYNEFAAKFPYAETEDQERAIEDTLQSMAGTHPMDRLVCGDVGFGKTEVALRAAYVAAMDGYQVAVVAPTTLLARQHFINFTKRFEGT
ncbi:MAG: CarD family transcriptional regulator, partial [Bdellovibrionales bacterium]